MILCNECAAREYLNGQTRDREPVSVGIAICEKCDGKRFCAAYKETENPDITSLEDGNG